MLPVVLSAFTQQVDWPFFGTIRLTTVLMAAITFGYWAWTTRRPVWAGIGTLAWACLYEVFFYATGLVTAGWDLSNSFWGLVAFTGWVWLAYIQGFRLHRWWFGAFVLLWLVWAATGWHYNNIERWDTFDPLAEAFNIATKTLLPIAFLAGTRSIRVTKLDDRRYAHNGQPLHVSEGGRPVGGSTGPEADPMLASGDGSAGRVGVEVASGVNFDALRAIPADAKR